MLGLIGVIILAAVFVASIQEDYAYWGEVGNYVNKFQEEKYA